MALTGIQIFKLLPKTNCKECGVPTCLAFAMNLASSKAELDACPYVSDEARAQLAEASAPPIRPVAVGKGVRAAKTGGETVLYRHEKTFFNPTMFAGTITSDTAEADVAAQLKSWNALQYERVGLNLRPELVALKDVNGDGVAFAALAKLIAETSEFNLILMSENAEIISGAVATAGFKRPLIYAATADNADAFGKIALDNELPLAVKSDSIDGLIALTDKLVGMGTQGSGNRSGFKGSKEGSGRSGGHSSGRFERWQSFAWFPNYLLSMRDGFQYCNGRSHCQYVRC